MNIEAAIKEYSHLLTREGSPRHLGELLFAAVLGKPKEWVMAHPDFELIKTNIDDFVNMAKRYALGEPVAYILGKKEFYGLEFFVDERVLIPRPETELLVEEVLGFVQKKCSKKKPVILDIGTGSGNIAISIASHMDSVEVFALDVSDDALEVALHNVKVHDLSSKVFLLKSDLLDNFIVQNVDVIVTNPPYIGTEVNDFVEPNTKKYEPGLALFSGEDGLDLYKKMFQQLKERNLQFSFMVGEFGFGQAEAMAVVLNKYFDHKFCIKKDLAGIDRYFIVDFS